MRGIDKKKKRKKEEKQSALGGHSSLSSAKNVTLAPKQASDSMWKHSDADKCTDMDRKTQRQEDPKNAAEDRVLVMGSELIQTPWTFILMPTP